MRRTKTSLNSESHRKDLLPTQEINAIFPGKP